MRASLIADIFRLSFSKEKFSQKISYLLRGVIFAPFLILEGQKQEQERRNTSDATQAGDDVYPLF